MRVACAGDIRRQFITECWGTVISQFAAGPAVVMVEDVVFGPLRRLPTNPYRRTFPDGANVGRVVRAGVNRNGDVEGACSFKGLHVDMECTLTPRPSTLRRRGELSESYMLKAVTTGSGGSLMSRKTSGTPSQVTSSQVFLSLLRLKL